MGAPESGCRQGQPCHPRAAPALHPLLENLPPAHPPHLQRTTKVCHQHAAPRRLHPCSEHSHQGWVQGHEGAQALAAESQVLGSDALKARHLQQGRMAGTGAARGGFGCD
jgi:hypothetical protein